MGDFIGPDNVETITNIDGSIYEKITHPNGYVERKLIRPPCYSPYMYNGYGEVVPIMSREAAYTHYTGTATASSITFGDYNELKKIF